MKICESAEIGRQAWLRIMCRKACGFKSRPAHYRKVAIGRPCCVNWMGDPVFSVYVSASPIIGKYEIVSQESEEAVQKGSVLGQRWVKRSPDHS